MACNNKNINTGLPSTSKGAIKKTILRNIEVPLESTKNRRSVVKLPSEHKNNNRTTKNNLPTIQIIKRKTKIDDKICQDKNDDKSLKNKFHTPHLNTVLELKDKLEKLHLKESEKIESLSQLTPKTRSAVAHEISKKLNFPFDQKIYKNLIPINVNDSILMIPEKRKPIHKKYISKMKKDPEPELSDFLKPIEPLEHIIPLYDISYSLRKSKNDNFHEFYELDMNLSS